MSFERTVGTNLYHADSLRQLLEQMLENPFAAPTKIAMSWHFNSRAFNAETQAFIDEYADHIRGFKIIKDGLIRMESHTKKSNQKHPVDPEIDCYCHAEYFKWIVTDLGKEIIKRCQIASKHQILFNIETYELQIEETHKGMLEYMKSDSIDAVWVAKVASYGPEFQDIGRMLVFEKLSRKSEDGINYVRQDAA